jgi:hypothetical protein
MKNHPTWPGTHFTTQEYTLCTNHDDPNGKANKKLLEEL